MSRTIVGKGRVTGPRTVELDHALPEGIREVEVVAILRDETAGKVSDYLRSLSPGSRTKDEIDQQIREERGSWSQR